MLRRFSVTGGRLVATPADPNIRLTRDMCPSTEEERRAVSKLPYRELVGSLMYAASGTRPDIAVAVMALCKYLGDPGAQHWTAAVRVLRYLAGTPDLGLTYCGAGDIKPIAYFARGHPVTQSAPASQPLPPLFGFSDSDYAGDPDKRRSVSAYVFQLAGAAISWKCRMQPTVALSSCEAEYMALAMAAQETIWLRTLLSELGFEQLFPTVIAEDNRGAIAIANNTLVHDRSKHIDIKHHFIRDTVERRQVVLQPVSTKLMVADILTKPLFKAQFQKLRGWLLGT